MSSSQFKVTRPTNSHSRNIWLLQFYRIKQTKMTTIGGKPTNQPFYIQVKCKDKALIFRHGNIILVK